MKAGILAVLIFVWAGAAAAATDAEKCEAAKLKIAGKYNSCRLKAEAKAVKTGDSVDYTKCDSKYVLNWGTVESKGGGMCPTNGDQADIQNQISADADLIALKLRGVRFADNGDGTVTDVETGLMWEKKDDAGGIHDKDNVYTWSATATGVPDGTAFTTFLGTLNHGTSPDANGIFGCFAGHCDWRLPTSAELLAILLAPCETMPCIDPVFGPTQSDSYWSATTTDFDSLQAWRVNFNNGTGSGAPKSLASYVRAVRGGL